MDRWRAAGALLALAACIASSVAAPTSTNDHTSLDLYDADHAEGCYYNFQHYGEGDRIMTNEPCLNCTCHNRMLMCYLRVCPFTKAIGQDCTVEKRADQCCPIVTCPDVPVDLLTSTSTSSPAEYGGTGVGKVDNYGCTIHGKYFSEGSKVPQTPGKPCEHCYCIRNMTTCVMQECTLHVDGCTPIYHKDVCCPVRYFCEHAEDEMPLLDDMTTTVRPTPGFLLTTTPGSDVPTTTFSPRRNCNEDNQMYPDGALIKTEKPCQHCYCMKGDIVCVIQECGTPMENEGKNCTSLPPREGQCCPDTYICEGDELSSEPATDTPFEELTTISPPRRVSVEGSGYRNEDETPYTEAPTFSTETEGSGEDESEQKPFDKVDVEQSTVDEFSPAEDGEFIPKSTETPTLEEVDKGTTESDKGLNTVPSGVTGAQTTDTKLEEKTTQSDTFKVTETSLEEQTTIAGFLEVEESSKPSKSEETQAPHLVHVTQPTFVDKPNATTIEQESTVEPSVQETIPKGEEKTTLATVTKDQDSEVTKSEVEYYTKTAVLEEQSTTEGTKISEQDTVPNAVIGLESIEPSMMAPTLGEDTSESITLAEGTRRKPSIPDDDKLEQTVVAEQITSSSVVSQETSTPVPNRTTIEDRLDVTEPAPINEQNTVPVDTEDEQSPDSSVFAKTTVRDEKATEATGIDRTTWPSIISVEDSSEPADFVQATTLAETKTTDAPAAAEKEVPYENESTASFKEEEQTPTTEPDFKKEDEEPGLTEITTPKEVAVSEVVDGVYISSETSSPNYEESSTQTQPKEEEPRLTTISIPAQQDENIKLPTTQKEPDQFTHTTTSLLQQEMEQQTVTYMKETTTESIMELSTFAHIDDKKPDEIIPVTTATEKTDLGEMTTVNPEDNEIAEGPSPGRIPGEGDCLLEGITYKNDSIVPSNNKCHTGCKCVSSIIKCDPIICSPPPEYMDNCQLRYDTLESCCPTYICDNGKETIPPQPHSQMSGTESPTSSPSIECNGDQCVVVTDNKPSEISPERDGTSDCNGGGCNVSEQPIYQQGTYPDIPAGCADSKCELPTRVCSSGKCDSSLPSTNQQQEVVPTKDVSPACANSDDCKEIKTPCEGESCSTQTVIAPPQGISQICENEDECKAVKTPESKLPLCEGEACTNIKNCSADECKIVPSPPSQEGELCSEKNGCKIPEQSGQSEQCKDGACDETHVEDRIKPECTDSGCLQQIPAASPDKSTHTKPATTDLPVSEQTTIGQEIMKVGAPGMSELPTTFLDTTESSISEHSLADEQMITEHEPSVSDEEQKVTKAPEEYATTHLEEFLTEKPVDSDLEMTPETQTVLETSVTDIPQNQGTETDKESEAEQHITEISQEIATESTPQKVTQSEPTDHETKRPLDVTKSYDTQTENPTEDTDKQIDTVTALPQSDIDTKEPESISETEQNVTPGYPSETEEKTSKPKTEVEAEPDSSLSETASKTPDSSEIGAVSTETFMKATETAMLDTQETETKRPEISETPDENVTEKDGKFETTSSDEVNVTKPAGTFTNAPIEVTTVQQGVKIPERLPEENIETASEMPIPESSLTSDDYGTKVTERLSTKEEEQTSQPQISESVTTSVGESVTALLPEEKHTETPLSLVTSEAQTDATPAPIPISDDKIQTTTILESQEPMKTEEPGYESQDIPTEPSPSSVTERTDAEPTKIPITDEGSLNVNKKPTSVDTTETLEPELPVPETQEISTKTPVASGETVTEIETIHGLSVEKTTRIPLLPNVSEEAFERVTEREPSVTIEYEISTDESVQPEDKLTTKKPEKEGAVRPEDESSDEVTKRPDDEVTKEPDDDMSQQPEKDEMPQDIQTVEPEYVFTIEHGMQTNAPKLDSTQETQTEEISVVPEILEENKVTKAPVVSEVLSEDKITETPKTPSEEQVSRAPETIPVEEATETSGFTSVEKTSEAPEISSEDTPETSIYPEMSKDKSTEVPIITIAEETTETPEIAFEDKATESPETITEVKSTDGPNIVTEEKVTETTEITTEEKTTAIPEITKEKIATDIPEIPKEQKTTQTPEMSTVEKATQAPDEIITEEKVTTTHEIVSEEKVTDVPEIISSAMVTEIPDMTTEEKETPTTEEKATEAPVDPEITLKDKVTEAPEVTSGDKITEAPEITLKEKVTEVPKITMENKTTEHPEISSEDMATESPEVISDSEVTKAPAILLGENMTEASFAPEITAGDKVTEAPEMPSEDKATDGPKTTTDDKVTEAPEITSEDKASDTPETPSEDKIAEAPEIIPYDETTKAPEIASQDKVTDASIAPEISLEDKVTEVPDRTFDDKLTSGDVTEGPEVSEITFEDRVTAAPVLTSEDMVTGVSVISSEEKVTPPPPPSEVSAEEKSPETSPEKAITGSPVKEPAKTEFPTTIPEKHQVPDEMTYDKETTKIPERYVPEQEISSEVPGEFETNETITDLPDISRTKVPESPATEKYATKAPEKEFTEENVANITVEDTTITRVPELPSDEQNTESPQESHITQIPESLTTVVQNVQQDKQTYPPTLYATETQQTKKPEPATTEETLQPIDESVPVEYTGSTELPTETGTLPVPAVSELIDDKEQEPAQTSRPETEYSETTPYLVELEEHTHKTYIEVSTVIPLEEQTTASVESHEPEIQSQVTTETVSSEEQQTEPLVIDSEPVDHNLQAPEVIEEPQEVPEKSTESTAPAKETLSENTSSAPTDSTLIEKYGPESEEEKETSTPEQILVEEHIPTISVETEKPFEQSEKEVTDKPQEVPVESTAPEEEFIPVTAKVTTVKAEEEPTTPIVQFVKSTKSDEKLSEVSTTTPAPEVSKPDELHPTDEIPAPEDDGNFPPSGGYNQEPDYVEEDQAFGPGTCRYGGKVYVSAQQIPRDDPCDFCFCFRSDIICLQQSCPPPIHGCHEEPIQGFCCPRYECPVSMATTLNVTTTTTTTTTTVPPHFLPHAYKGAAQRRGCQIKGHTYKVGEVVRASSGPCLHCTCGGDGQMKCDPKACTPEPMLRQMIAAAVSAKRRR